MLRSKEYDFSKKKLDFGYKYLNTDSTPYTLSSIVSTVKTSIIVFDSNNLIIDSLLYEANSLINDNDKLFIGLVNENKLADLKHKNLVGGFFRSTKETTKAAIVVVDKDYYFACYSKDVIFFIGRGLQYIELFNLINHYIWSKATAELCKGQFKQVNETRLSIVYPEFTEALKIGINEIKNFNIKYKLSNKFVDETGPTLITKTSLYESFLDEENNLYLNVFDNYYYKVDFMDFCISAKSFENETLGELITEGNKTIWHEGDQMTLLSSDEIQKVEYVEVDKYKEYIPNFDSYVSSYKNNAIKLNVVVDVLPITIDSTYKLSPKYEKIKHYMDELNSGIQRIKSLFGKDKKLEKQIETIEKERNLFEKAELYNKFISENQAGVSSLNNQKNNFKPIIIDKVNLIVPNEIIGKLYYKGNQEYLALKSEELIQDGKDWLKENKFFAAMVLLNE